MQKIRPLYKVEIIGEKEVRNYKTNTISREIINRLKSQKATDKEQVAIYKWKPERKKLIPTYEGYYSSVFPNSKEMEEIRQSLV